jgi:murein DD-endopeptidase MepM/ murein hydrolase activator NlpD
MMRPRKSPRTGVAVLAVCALASAAVLGWDVRWLDAAHAVATESLHRSAVSTVALDPGPRAEALPYIIAQATPAPVDAAAIDAVLAARGLLVPVAGVSPSELRDSFAEQRGKKAHEAIDIPAARATPVVAVDDGRVVKLFHSVPGGLTIYQADMADEFIYYYALLGSYVDGLRVGDGVRRGDVLGYVGSTGNAAPAAPHLHFAIMRLPPGKEWWKGTAINPLPYLTRSLPPPRG